jgi:hypothetical protein
MRQLELALDRGRSVLSGRNRNRQNDADGERGANQQTGLHTVAESRARIVSVASDEGIIDPAQT